MPLLRRCRHAITPLRRQLLIIFMAAGFVDFRLLFSLPAIHYLLRRRYCHFRLLAYYFLRHIDT